MLLELSAWEFAGLISKLFWYLGVIAATGGTFSVWLLSDSSRSGMRWSLFYSLAGALVGFHAVIVYFLVQVGAANSSGLTGMLDWSLIRFYLELEVGETSLLRMAIFLILAVIQIVILAWLGRLTRPPGQAFYRLFYRLNGAALLILLLSFQATGHVAPLGLPVRAALVLHVTAAVLWLGSLWPLLRASWIFESGHFRTIIRLFSRRATVMVAVLLVSAIILLFQLLTTPSEFVVTAYGLSLLLKIALVGALLSLAALNRWWLTPKLDQPGAVMHLRRSLTLELVVGVLILLATVFLSTVVGPASHS